jgi:hypothetical protein
MATICQKPGAIAGTGKERKTIMITILWDIAILWLILLGLFWGVGIIMIMCEK